MTQSPILSETAKQPLLCGRHLHRKNGLIASIAQTQQMHATQALPIKTFESQSSPAAYAQDSRVIKRLIIHPALASSGRQYEAPDVARLPASPAQGLGVIKRLIIQSSQDHTWSIRSALGIGCRPAPGACVIKPLIIHLQPTAGGQIVSQPTLGRLPGPARQTTNFSVIKRLIPPLVLPARKAPSTGNFHPTEPCSAGFSRFWGSDLQGAHL